MKRKRYLSGLVLALLVLGLVALLAACASGGSDVTRTTFSVVTSGSAISSTSSSVDETSTDIDSDAAALSTFQSKDPFIQQAQPVTTTPTTPTTITTGTTSSTIYTTTSYYYNTTSTYYYTTTTTAHATTTTTIAHLHTLKILSISTVSGAAVVSFKVDSTNFTNKHVGDVVSTTWGQIEVVQISTSSKVVTLLHGSETLILGVGQSTFE